MNIETRIKLDRFEPKSYQVQLFEAMATFKKGVFVWPRRSGKDIAGFNFCVRECLKRVGTVYYIWPTYSLARKALWDAMTICGKRIIDWYIPPELVKAKNSSELKITFVNGSVLQLIGSDNFDNLRGTNSIGAVFTEYAWQDPRVYTNVLRPILLASDGFQCFLSTPFGRNHFWELYNIAKHNPDEWYVSHLTIEDTNHISLADIERERREGLISDDQIQQEYFCSFSAGVEGSYYSKYIAKLRLNNQIATVPYEAAYRVNTAWDIGVRDSTAIIFFQIVGQTIRIIDCYSNQKEGLEHYIQLINSKPYHYQKHFAPHDISVKEWGSGLTRIEKARQLGINFTVVDNLTIMEGIESVRSLFSKVWIDEKLCAPLIKALENYRQEYDTKRGVYKPNALHDWSSHFADSMRYLALSLPKVRDGLTPEDIDRQYNEAHYGYNTHMPSVFRDDLPSY